MSPVEKLSVAPLSDLQKAWTEGSASGPAQPFDIEETKRRAREGLRRFVAQDEQ